MSTEAVPQQRQQPRSTRLSDSLAVDGETHSDDEFHDTEEYSKPIHIRPSLQPAKRKSSQQHSLNEQPYNDNENDIDEEHKEHSLNNNTNNTTISIDKASTQSNPINPLSQQEKPVYALNTNTNPSKTSYSTSAYTSSASAAIQPSSSQQQPAFNRSLSRPLPPVPVNTSPQQLGNKNANLTNGALLSANTKGASQASPQDHTTIKNLDTGEECDINQAMEKFPDEMMTIDQYEAQRIADKQQQQQQPQAQQGMNNTRVNRSVSVSQVSDAADIDDSADSQVSGESKKKSLGFIVSKMKRALQKIGGDDDHDTSGTSSNIRKSATSVRSKVKRKNYQDFSDVHCVQTITEHNGPIWTFALSHDGHYLATGGQDSVIRVWAVMGSAAANEMIQQHKQVQAPSNSQTDSTDHSADNAAQQPINGNAAYESTNVPSPHQANDQSTQYPSTDRASTTQARSQANAYLQSQRQTSQQSNSKNPHAVDGGQAHPIVYPIPYRTYVGHKADIVDLAWSKANFLLSASIDKTVRLWHISRAKCLCLFQHSDFVTAVAFHPIEDRYFLSASFDKKLRVWNIPEHRVVEWTQTSTIITACAFSPNGAFTVAGLYNGQCIFYATEGLKYYTQVECRNRRGKYRHGKKVTGLQFSGDGKYLLVTTNDSRIRLYDMDDYRVVAKFKGTSNEELQIRAYFDETSRYIICGSENECVYVWNNQQLNTAGKVDSYEYFKACADTVTCARMLPRATIRLAHSQYNNNNPAATSQAAIGSQTSSSSLPSAASPSASESQVYHLIAAAGYNGDLRFYEERGGRKQL